MIRHSTAATLLLCLALLGCKQPGTDRELQCERFGDALFERRIECGGKVIDGVKLTESNGPALIEKMRTSCRSNSELTPTTACIKALKAAPCDGDKPSAKSLGACGNLSL